ncbi:MAG: DNA polymerase sliding clamp [Halobacteriota archaeon]|nr:DNA polymerase sliding clamp [Halobacteriota archaeon]
MLKAVISANRLKEIIDAVSTLVDEVKFKLSNNGISIRAVDPANVAMVSFEISSDAFESFEASDGVLGVDLKKLKDDVLSMVSGSEDVLIELEDGKLLVKFLNLTYAISLLDPSSIRKEPKVPSLELPAQIVLSGDEFRRAVQAAGKISDHIAFGVEGEVFFMEAKGDLDRVRLELTKDKLISLKSAPARSLYSLDYLSDMIKPISKTDEVCIDIGKDFPMKISFTIAEDKGKVEYLLAPRVEAE